MPEGLSQKEQVELALRNFDVAIKFLAGKEYSTLNNAILNLIKGAHRETNRLLASLDDITLASLAVRNIFEIYLISKHIHSIEIALLSWYGQSHKDSKDVRDGFIKLMEKKGLDTSELESIQKFEDRSLQESPFESKGGFQVRDLAERYGCLDDYKFIYKLSSKIVHPSAMKVMSYDVLTEKRNYLSAVLQVGVYFSQEFNIFLQAIVNENA